MISMCYDRKLIGARYYLKGYEARYGPLNITTDSPSPRDMDGHGTHTASMVEGRGVPLGGFSVGPLLVVHQWPTWPSTKFAGR
ncbi:putative peptidase S8/S53 domain superfamily [Helianthus debilis subsp. tardiflorus]